ncbi:MAG: hypothetical protein ACMV0H_04130, partial [Aquaspirillum sp.]
NGGPQGNNGHGNGDQDAPGNSLDNNNAENSENSGAGNSGGSGQSDDKTFEELVQQAGDEAEYAADVTGFNQDATGSATTQGGSGEDPAASGDLGLSDPVFGDASGFSPQQDDTQQPDMLVL